MDRKLYAAALRYLGKRPRSEKEVKEFLLKLKAKIEKVKATFKDDPLVDEIVIKLKQQKFIDDFEFARMWIEQRTRIKVKGLRAIEFELKQKGISKEIISAQFLNLKNEENTEFRRNEKELALNLAQKRMRLIKDLPREKIYQRLGGFLIRRGFDLDTVKSVIDEILRKEVK